MARIVNTAMGGRELERLLAAKLEELLCSVRWLGDPEISTGAGWDCDADIHVTVALPTGTTAHLLAWCQREPRPSHFPLLAARAQGRMSPAGLTVPILAVPHISPRLAAVARQNGWSWLDLAGNCDLDIPGLLHIERTGNPPAYRAPSPTANLGSPESARVLRALLAPQHTGRIWTQRGLRLESQPMVSLGLVNKVARHLREEACIEEVTETGFRVRDPEGALRAWAPAYGFERHSRAGFFTLLRGRQLAEALMRLEEQAGGRASYAGFSAAEVQAPHVRQTRTWLYLAPEAEALFCSVAEARPVDTGENVTVLFPADDGVFYLLDRAADRLSATNPVQTYVDLLHGGGRGEEAAEALLEQCLRPAWKPVTGR